jgi:hypothetical protein
MHRLEKPLQLGRKSLYLYRCMRGRSPWFQRYAEYIRAAHLGESIHPLGSPPAQTAQIAQSIPFAAFLEPTWLEGTHRAT